MHVCEIVAQGNDLVDYYTQQGIDDPRVISHWKFQNVVKFLGVILIVVASLMCVLCSLSCFYQYRVHHHHDPPFPVCSWCPDCLFPVRDYKKLLEE